MGIAGLGGLGVMGIKLAKALGCTVTALSRTSAKSRLTAADAAYNSRDFRSAIDGLWSHFVGEGGAGLDEAELENLFDQMSLTIGGPGEAL